jgi:hypothetical protein
MIPQSIYNLHQDIHCAAFGVDSVDKIGKNLELLLARFSGSSKGFLIPVLWIRTHFFRIRIRIHKLFFSDSDSDTDSDS